MISLPTGRQYILETCGFAVGELLSWLAYRTMGSETVVLLIVVIAALVVAWKRPTWLAYATVAELIVGGKGYLFYLPVGHTHISIRLLLFLILFITSAPRIFRQWRTLRQTVLPNSLLILVGWIALMAGWGIVRGNSLHNVFFDGNAFLYLFLLPAWWLTLRTDSRWQERILLLLISGATLIAVKSWLTVALFSQNLSIVTSYYHWIRDTGIGEITFISNGVYRVFFQSQIYSLFVFGAALVIWVSMRVPRWWIIPLFASAVGVYISLSRSFWLGFGVMLLLIVGWLIRQRYWHAIGRFWVLIPIALAAWAMLIWADSFPQFLIHGRANPVFARFTSQGSYDANAARKNQIKPLFTAIAQHPIIGSGFGTTVTYYSTDPRIRGWRTTTAFELGYLDLWLKIGIVGIVIYAWWIISIWRRGRSKAWSMIFLVSGIGLIAVHIVSPYLNHPLGLGWIMLTSLYANAS